MFSVIIPSYNRRALLEKALDSVWAQGFGDYEVVVVDDGSTDDTWTYLLSLGSRVMAVRQQNRGPGAARNLGACRANGDYLAFLDSDDLWSPWALDVYAGLLRKANLPSFLVGRPLKFDGDESPGWGDQVVPTSATFADYLASGDVWRWWGASSFVIAREEFQKVGGFCEANVNSEDADLALKLGTSPGFVQVLSPPTFGYRSHADNVTAVTHKTTAGARIIVDSERAGRYPGGPSRAWERHTIITRHLRPAILDCLRSGNIAEGWHLYVRSWLWNLGCKRVLFLTIVPLLVIWFLLRPRRVATEAQ